MNVLIGCEESQVECMAFRRLGHNAFSCDIKSCSGGFPEYHILGDIFSVLPDDIGSSIIFETQDGITHIIDRWDIAIFHPPCTYLSYAGIGYFNVNKYGDKALQRYKDREDAARFFMDLYNCNIPCVCCENPNGYMSKYFRKPDQVLHPYQFGDAFAKRTCYWYKNLPPLMSTLFCNEYSTTWLYEYNRTKGCRSKSEYRSKSFPGIANAMAYQWTPYEYLKERGLLL